ncbi:PREDICTED: protein STRUBBELIG-RECEPTOR FAMILY 6-like [Theobroma cacao]|uniref:Protein STRUBBELIG-RECEPTOR FAMILY 6-like n=1 Tax=Theobroma cacao TaxID=3641 RepID=A0AB32VRB1_THECC|nr:PREDICTED: protein STRUBBELIG-RECEPTOR FAMILY 6-like [Theobroma cacao]
MNKNNTSSFLSLCICALLRKPILLISVRLDGEEKGRNVCTEHLLSDQTRKLERQGPAHKPLDSDADNDVVASDSPGDKRPSLDDEKSGGSGTAELVTGKSNFERPVVYSFNDLRAFTNNFSADNLIGLTQFGRLYRGKIEKGKEARFVTVKTWDERSDRFLYPPNKTLMLREEAMLLTHPSMRGHPNLVKLVGGCRQKEMKAAVYDLNPLDTLHNYMQRGTFIKLSKVREQGRLKVH